MSIPEVPIALVTGANRGLGFEISRQLARQDITVLLAGRNRTRGKAAAKRLRDEGLIVQFIELDVTKPVQIKKAAAEIRRRYGKLDILVNNAGISIDGAHGRNSTATVSARALRKTFDVNFFGLVELTQRLLPLIIKSGAGRIVNISSILGSMTVHGRAGGMSYKPFAYDASKTAVNVFTIHLAAALAGTNVKVNAVHPGWVRTGMGGPGALLAPEEGARTAVRLATLGADGPTGKFFSGNDELPW
jgi:NAD(P)-dependent dehydrogenase (short-subunit alcohol dehydrogenase family)